MHIVCVVLQIIILQFLLSHAQLELVLAAADTLAVRPIGQELERNTTQEGKIKTKRYLWREHSRIKHNFCLLGGQSCWGCTGVGAALHKRPPQFLSANSSTHGELWTQLQAGLISGKLS